MSVQSAAVAVNPSFVADRYPPAVLAHGWTAAPNLVRQAWPALGATYAAYFLYETIISYQRGTTPPAVYVDQLAADLQINPRRIRALTAQLVGLGLLVVGRAIDGRNLYDFRPLYARVEARVEAQAQAREGAAAADRRGSPARPADTKAALSVRASGRKPAAYEEVPKNTRFDSIPPTPCDERIEDRDDADPERQAVAAAIASIGATLGDNAPRSSTTRALRMFDDSGLAAGAFLALADDARRVTERRRRKAPPIARPMAYWFDVLRVLIDDQGRTPSAPPPRPRATTRPRSSPLSPASPPPAPVAVPEQTADAWGQVRAELAAEITAENYARWFAPTHQTHYDAGVLTVAVLDDFHRQWLDRRLRGAIERCVGRVLPGTRVLFVVEARA